MAVRIEDPETDESKAAEATGDDGDETTPLGERIEETKATEEMRFVINPYKPNYIMVGYNPNGRNRPLSRSWNRLFASFIFERGNLAFGIKPWIIIGDVEDNSDIQDYLGNFEIRAAYKWKRHTFSLLSRNQLQSGFSKGAFLSITAFGSTPSTSTATVKA